MRTLNAITTVLLISTIASAAYAQTPTAPRTINEDSSSDTGTTRRVERRAPERALEVGVNGGYTQPFGEMGDGVGIRGVAIAGGAVGLTLGYRFSPHWSLEGAGQFQELMAGDNFDGTTAAIRGITMGIQATYHFRPYKIIDPYATLGTGYRMMWIAPAGAPNDMIHGFEIGKAILGVDFRMTPSFALGPMIGADLNIFVWNNPAGAGGDEQVRAPRPSTFLFAGLGGRFDIGGDRVPRERMAQAHAPPRAASLRPAPPPPPARPPERPIAISIEKRILDTCKIEGPKAYFDFGEASVKDADQGTLDQVAECFTTGPLKGRAMKVVGHADPRGTDKYNERLGQSRAKSVSEYLSDKGVSALEMNTESRGEQDATGSDELGWAHDRRVEIRLGD